MIGIRSLLKEDGHEAYWPGKPKCLPPIEQGKSGDYRLLKILPPPMTSSPS